jgi:hypothetical protein
MNGKNPELDELHLQGLTKPADRQVQLTLVIGSLENALHTLESLQLTLAVALLDHAIAETEHHLAPCISPRSSM